MTAATCRPGTHHDDGTGQSRPVLVWRFDPAVRAVASTVLGGGIGRRSWVVNAEVASTYRRPDPAGHVAMIAARLGLPAGSGVGMLTAARVLDVATHHDGGVDVAVTVGLSRPTWAAGDGTPDDEWAPGTVNLVCQLPVPLSDAALVNAVGTATEAKAQALFGLGVPGTGTASDAVVVCCPDPDVAAVPPEPYGGPRSRWGAPLARSVYAAVAEAATRYLAGRRLQSRSLPTAPESSPTHRSEARRSRATFDRIGNTLLLGGARSGKSALAERLAGRLPPPLTYLATAVVRDDDHAARVAEHRARRDPAWTTVETGPALVQALRGVAGSVLVDSLGAWVSAHEDLAVDPAELCDVLRTRRGDAVVVSEEVGLGVHPSTAAGRRFRDVLGTVNAAVAEVCDDVSLVVAGRLLELRRPTLPMIMKDLPCYDTEESS